MTKSFQISVLDPDMLQRVVLELKMSHMEPTHSFVNCIIMLILCNLKTNKLLEKTYKLACYLLDSFHSVLQLCDVMYFPLISFLSYECRDIASIITTICLLLCSYRISPFSRCCHAVLLFCISATITFKLLIN